MIGDAVYCNDWMIDAALLSQAELLKSEGITFDCALPGFYCGQMPRQELLYLILFLLNLGSTEIRETAGERTLFFHVNTIANQLIIELVFPMQEKGKLPERQIRSFLSGFTYTLQITKENNIARLVLALERQEENRHEYRTM